MRMNNVKSIRKVLNVTQQELADGVQMTQGNISNYERGQTVPPDVAGRIIAFASGRGVDLTFDHIYGLKPIPEPV